MYSALRGGTVLEAMWVLVRKLSSTLFFSGDRVFAFFHEVVLSGDRFFATISNAQVIISILLTFRLG